MIKRPSTPGVAMTGATGKLMEDWSESFVVNEAEATMMYNWLYGPAALANIHTRSEPQNAS